MRLFVLGLVAGLLTGCAHALVAGPSSPERLTVTLAGVESKEGCCGVVVGPSLVITAAHCLVGEQHESVRLKNSDAEEFEGSLASSDPGSDLVLLKTEHRFAASAVLRSGPIGELEPLSSVRMGRQVSPRRESARVIDSNWFYWMLLDLKVQRGASGSGIWDARGRLAGIVLRRRNGMTEVARAVQVAGLVSLAGAGS